MSRKYALIIYITFICISMMFVTSIYNKPTKSQMVQTSQIGIEPLCWVDQEELNGTSKLIKVTDTNDFTNKQFNTVKSNTVQEKTIKEETTTYVEPESTRTPLTSCTGFDNFSDDLKSYVKTISSKYGLEYYVVFAVIQVESNFDINAYNGGCVGLMQISSGNYGWLNSAIGTTNLSDPYQNIEAGCFILNYFMNQGYTMEQSLVCYNVGHLCADSTYYSRHVLELSDNYKNY